MTDNKPYIDIARNERNQTKVHDVFMQRLHK